LDSAQHRDLCNPENPLVPDGTAIFHLLRNMGNSIFISLSVALVIRETKRSHAELLPDVSPFKKVFQLPDVPEL
jgi:DHA2 family multidrug resistance protein